MSQYLQYHRPDFNDDGWQFADTSDPEAWWIQELTEMVRAAEPMPSDAFAGNYNEDLHNDLLSLKAQDAPKIRKYLKEKGAAYRDGMQAFLEYLEQSKEPVMVRFRD